MEFLNIKTKRQINKAMREAGVDSKITYKKAAQIKSGSIIIPEMWCGIALQFYLIKPAERLLFIGQVIRRNGKSHFIKDNKTQPINF